MRHSMRCCWRPAVLESHLRTDQQSPVNMSASPTSYPMFGKEVDIDHGVRRTNQTAPCAPRQSNHIATGSCLPTQ